MGLLQKMAWSKGTRIKVMIALDTAFFILELTTGFLAHSLALMADAFHMLNDIISLIIGLWAVSAAQKATTNEFTFGWVRAEILGAFFNAVFLIALCVSIILEALTRFIEPPEIDNPKMMLIVGSAGLFSNLLGFVVLGGHGHAHGHSHDDHDHDDHEHAHDHQHTHTHDEEEGLISHSHSHDHVSEETRRIRFDEQPDEHRHNRDESSAGASRRSAQFRNRDRRHSVKSGHSRLASFEDMSIHPASFRQEIIAASMPAAAESVSESDTDVDASFNAVEEATEESPLLKGIKKTGGSTLNAQKQPHHSHSHSGRKRRDSSVHQGHNHTLPKKASKKGHGHDHGDMGMNAMVLHVIGDALGNIGVMATALVIWLTDWPGKLYADPAVSLFITAIILKTSIPLTRATARVLLQATPEHIDIQEIREDIEALPCVVTCHHIHVWQLSDTKLVASMHIQVSFPIDSHSGEKYMELARRARKCLHAYGIHSATIQPEFCLDQKHLHQEEEAALTLDGVADSAKGELCLLECVDDCRGKGCCSNIEASSRGSSTRRASDSSASIAGHEDHNHNHNHTH